MLLVIALIILLNCCWAELLANPGFELPTNLDLPVSGYTSNYWGNLNVQFTRTSSTRKSGASSVCTDIKSPTSTNQGDAKWIPDPVQVTAGQQLVFEGWFQANPSQALTVLIVEHLSGDSKAYYWLKGDIKSTSSSEWTKFSVPFTVRPNVLKISPTLYSTEFGKFCQDDFSLVSVSPVPDTSGNLLTNPGFESPSSTADPQFGWTSNRWGNVRASFFASSSVRHSGKQSACAQVTLDTSSAPSGDAKWIPKEIAVPHSSTSGREIVFSGWFYSDSGQSVSVLVQTKHAVSGQIAYNWVKGGLTSSPGTWMYFSVDYLVPSGTGSFSPYLYVREPGLFCLDDMEVVWKSDDSADELLLNPGFELPSQQSLPVSGWSSNTWGGVAAVFTRSSSHVYQGEYSLCVQLTSAPGTGDAKWMPTPVSVRAGDVFVFSGWLKAISPSNSQTLVLAVRQQSTSGAFTYPTLASLTASSSWTYFEHSFTVPPNIIQVSPFALSKHLGAFCQDSFSLRLQDAFPPNNPRPILPTLEGCGHRKVAALTLDDGPAVLNDITQTIIDSLASRGVRVTFYVSPGGWGAEPDKLAGRCELVRKLVAAGHSVQSHSWSHSDFKQLSDEQIVQELQRVGNWMVGCGAPFPVQFRPPFGSLRLDQAKMIASLGYTIAFWNHDTFDYLSPNSLQTVTDALLPRLQSSKSLVLLMHDRSSYQTVGQIVDLVKSSGFTFVSGEQCYEQCDSLDKFGVCRTIERTPHYQLTAWDAELYAGDPLFVRCGSSWANANSKCGTSCSGNGDCPSGESCFSSMALSPCLNA